MLTNWRVWYLTTVAAVGGALILGVTAPVRAAVVTYTLKYAELTNDDAVKGCYEFDSSENEKTQANRTVCDNEDVINNIKQNIAPRYAGPGASRLKKPNEQRNPRQIQIGEHRRKYHHAQKLRDDDDHRYGPPGEETVRTNRGGHGARRRSI